MLRFITGLDPRGRRELLYSMIEGCGGGAVLVVPEQFSFESERLLGERLGAASAEAVEVLSFSRLCDSVFRRCGGLAGDHVDDPARLLLMSAALSEVSDRLTYYTKRSHGPAFVQKLVKAEEELANAGASPQELSDVAARADDGSVLKAKAADLALVFSAYKALLERGFIDPLEDIPRAVKLLSRNDLFSGRAVFLDGFTGFTGSEFRLLALLLEQAPMLTVSLCCDDIHEDAGGAGLFTKPARTASRLIALARNAGVAVAAPLRAPEGGYWRSPPLRHLAENFLRARPLPYDGEEEGAVCAVSAADPYDEARWVAAKCRELAEKGCRWRDIAVIARSLAPYEHALPAAFAHEGIPFYLDRREDISARPPAACLTAALEACRTGLDPAPFFRMLKTGLSPLTAEEVAALENYCFVWNIRGALWGAPFTANPSGFTELSPDDAAELSRINGLRERAAAPVLKLRERLSGADGRRFAEALWGFIEDFDMRAGLERLAAEYEEAGDAGAADGLDALWSCIVSTLDRFSATLAGVVLPKDGLSRLFELSLSAADLGSLPRSLDCVSIGEADRARPFEPSVMFVLGVTEGDFPRPPAAGALFTDPDREAMATLGLELADTADDQLLAERLFAYAAFSAPRELLFVSFPRLSVAGAEASPSVLINSCLALFPGLSVRETAAEPPEFYLHSPATAFELLSACGEPTPFSEALRDSLLALPEWREKALRLARPVVPAAFAMEDGEAARRLFGGELRLSPSGVESYHSCRFKYFASYGLRLKERRAAGLSPLETGELIHDALYTVVSKYGAAGLCELSPEALSKEADAVLTASLEAAVGEGGLSTNRLRYLFGRLSGFLQRLLLRLAAEFRQSAFEPAAFEQELSDDGDVPPLRLVTPDGHSVLVSGRIDRVDVLNKNGRRYVRVVDYKSGAKSFALSDVYYGLNLQMLVYLFAVWQGGRGKLSGSLPAGVLYMPAKDKALTGGRHDTAQDAQRAQMEAFRMNGLLLDDPDVLSAMEPGLAGVFLPVKAGGRSDSSLATLAELGAIRGHIEKLLCDMVDELARGRIGAVPVSDGKRLPCEYCGFADVCRRAPDGVSMTMRNLKKADFYKQIEEADGNG